MTHKWNSNDLELLLCLLRGDAHLRELARVIKQPRSTLMRRLHELVKHNVIDYKEEGQNKVYFIKKSFIAKQYVYQAERYKLIKLLEAYPELSVVLDSLLRKLKDPLVVLFGSYAKFSAKKDSDIDIYVETKSRTVRNKAKEIHSAISVKTGPFNTEDLLIKEIIKNHIILRGVEQFYDETKFFE